MIPEDLQWLKIFEFRKVEEFQELEPLDEQDVQEGPSLRPQCSAFEWSGEPASVSCSRNGAI